MQGFCVPMHNDAGRGRVCLVQYIVCLLAIMDCSCNCVPAATAIVWIPMQCMHCIARRWPSHLPCAALAAHRAGGRNRSCLQHTMLPPQACDIDASRQLRSCLSTVHLSWHHQVAGLLRRCPDAGCMRKILSPGNRACTQKADCCKG